MLKRRWLRDLAWQMAAIALALATALVAAEALARHHYPNLRLDPLRRITPEELFLRFDPRLGWFNVPNRQVQFQGLDFEERVSINADGLRGPQIPRERTPGRFRVLLAGDSYAFGHGVNDDETSAADLERLLPRLEVVNLGVIGYSTDQELMLLRDQGFDWNPDLVVLYLAQDDLLDNGKETAWGLYPKPRYVVQGDSLALDHAVLPSQMSPSEVIGRSLRRRFVLYDVVTRQMARLQRGVRPRSDDDVDPGAAVTAASPVGKLTRDLLQEMARLCRQRGVPFLLVVVPPFSSPALVSDLPAPEAGARLDLTPVFDAYRSAHPDSALTYRYDPHWNARGQRVAAEAVAERIRERGWWPRP